MVDSAHMLCRFPKLIGVISIAVILIDYAALDDITTGSEPSFILEYLFLMFSVVWFVILAITAIGRRITS